MRNANSAHRIFSTWTMLFGALALPALAGCPASVPEYCEQGGCDFSATEPADGGVDGAGGGGLVVPADCDLTKGVKDSPACVDDGVGVFVSASGDEGAEGTKTAPVKTIAKGVQLALSKGLPRVYVCAGVYDTAVAVGSPLGVFGGLSCEWVYTGVKPRLVPANGIALRVTKVTGAARFEDLDVTGSADPNTPGDSAIAVFVSESADVTFKNVTLTARAGTKGKKGSGRSNYTGAVATQGGPANGGMGGTGASCTCVDGTTSTGGNGAGGNGVGLTDGAANPPVGSSNAGTSSTTSCTVGTIGTNGAAGGAGAAAEVTQRLDASGWSVVTKSAPAPNGQPGQGGGGGGGRTNVNSAGGGGGCGGCGGAGGDVGLAGGSSFALLSFKSGVTIEVGVLLAGPGGAGGDGGDGQAGQTGGPAGLGGTCDGGPGAHGAGGSGGGGGAGGHSVAIGFVGAEPKVMKATLMPGTKGPGGKGGSSGTGPGNAGTTGDEGIEGKSQSTLAL